MGTIVKNANMFKRFLKAVFEQKLSRTPPRMPEGIRIYAVGDIHGRLDLLEEVHAKMIADVANGDARQIIQIFVGDYVDRGASSKGVINWLLAPPPDGWQRFCLKGNHEAIVLDFLEDAKVFKMWGRLGGLETLHSYGVDLARSHEEDFWPELRDGFAEKLPEMHREFYSNLLNFKEIGDYFFVHAGVRPGVPLDQQVEQDLLWIRKKFLSSNQDFGKFIVHGHTPVAEPEVLPNRINIDTGAYISDRLTCLVLEGEEQRFL